MDKRARRAKQGAKGKQPTMDARLAQACSHPLRAELLARLADHCASPKELAAELGEELSNVSYHVKQLLELDCVEIVEKTQVRGAVKTKYRATLKMQLTDETWRSLSKEARAGMSVNGVNELIALVTKAFAADTFDKRLDRHCINLKANLDEKGWEEAAAILALAYERLSRLEAESMGRTPEAERFPVVISLLSYEAARKRPQPEHGEGDEASQHR